MILHIDMDAFFASIEQAINPRLKGKPLIVGSRNSPLHTVVCAASYEAKAYGISSGMPSQEAFRICPNLQFVPAEQSKYIWTSEEILSLVKKYGFPVRYVSIDEFQIDTLEYSENLDLAEKIRAEIRENFRVTASIGIAKNCLLAKLASKLNKPNGVTEINQTNITAVLEQTPAKKLCGVGPKTAVVMEGLGINSCLDLYLKDPGFLKTHLGKYGCELYCGLHQKDAFLGLKEEEKTKSIGHSYTLPMASETPGFIRAWIRLLAEMVARRLREQKMLSQTVHLWLNGPEIGNFGAQQTFELPTDDGYEINRRCLKIMARTGRKRPKIRALGVTCSHLATPKYPPLFNEQKRRGALLEAVDLINSRHGSGSIDPAVIYLARSGND